jgi:hypothetical protein
MSTSRVLGLMIASAWLVAGCNGAKKDLGYNYWVDVVFSQ